MKTIVKIEVEDGDPASSYILRVNNLSAAKLVKEGTWQYTPKSLWKEKIRDINKNTDKKEDTSKSKKKKKSKKES
tara:strand:- start:198 stop:422 length:225 start_codon:yes stop_codon:yes gene_type:complete